MDYHPNMVSITSAFEQDDCSKLGAFQFSSTLDDDGLCSSQTTTEVDVSLEWLSEYVEECLSSKGSSLPLPLPPPSTHLNNPTTAPYSSNSPLTHFSSVPGKARSKRRRRATAKMSIHPLMGQRLHHSLQSTPSTSSSNSDSDSLLLQQTYWLAESELLLPHEAVGGEVEEEEEREKVVDMDERGTTMKSLKMKKDGGRRCSHCQAQRTPQWRGGPLGPKTLCNACGVRYKSGRLHPEYRPANSPTFVSFLHSNSHKRVMEMRMMNTSSSSSTSTTYPYST